MYYVLEKLEKQGLVKRLAEDSGRRKFRITSAGVGVLQTSMVDLLGTPHSYDKYFELGLANLHILKTSQVRSALLSRQQELTAQIERLSEGMLNEIVRDDSFQVRGMFSHRIAMMKAELAWLTEFIKQWEAQAKPDPEPKYETSEIPRSRQVVLPHDPDSVHKQQTKLASAASEKSPEKRATPPAVKGKTARLKTLTDADYDKPPYKTDKLSPDELKHKPDRTDRLDRKDKDNQ
jgi:DNA-binding PadR family transcriptional regulator